MQGRFCFGWDGLSHELIHHHVVAETSTHDKEVEDFMGNQTFCGGS